MSIGLYAFGIYHFTQPDAAWRSGTMETVTATCLLAAAYLLPLKAAVVIHFVFAVMLAGLGIRHAIHGQGYISGAAELIFAAALVYGAVVILKTLKNQS